MKHAALSPAAGVICEFNPFHNGHVRLLRAVRGALGDGVCIVCVMSGRFVQRGEPAAADPYLRARAALCGGADLVLELPFPWSAASAEHFADAGVSVLSGLGVETLAFGTESGDLTLLRAAAEVLAQPDFPARSAARVRQGDGAAVALSGLLREALSDITPALPDDFPSSNDRLAMQYLRAMHAAGDAMTPLAVRREGQAFRDETLHDPSAPSASAIRLLMREASADPDCLCAMLTGTMPDGALQVWLDAIRAGQAPTDGSALLPFLHAFFRLADPDELTGFSGLSGGLSHRLVRAALDAPTPAVFLSSLHSRLYTDARLRRAMLNAVLGVTDTDLRAVPVYTTLLAANRRGCAFLKDLRSAQREGSSYIPVVTKPADAPACRQTVLAHRADALFTLCLPRPVAAGDCLRQTAFISDQSV